MHGMSKEGGSKMSFQTYFDRDFCLNTGIPEGELCRWDAMSKTLSGSQKSKALKFNRNNLIKPDGKGSFQVLPIEGYNTTTYTVDYNGGWKCNCQWHCKNNADCSHILAVMLYLKRRGK